MNVAIIAAAGQGTRMGGKRAKQFLELAGTPVIIHTLKVFEQCHSIQEIIVVLPEQDVAGFASLADKHDLRKLRKTVAGGATRTESVFRGFREIDPVTAKIVAVHDGIRPFVTADELSKTIDAAEHNGAAILVAAQIDTVKEVANNFVVRTLPREQLRRALTPQCFRYALLADGFENVDQADPQLSDESSLMERLGIKVAIVEGSPRNIKLTTPEDLIVGEALLAMTATKR